MKEPDNGEEVAPPPRTEESSRAGAGEARGGDGSGGGGSDGNSADGDAGSDESSDPDEEGSDGEGSDGDRISPEDGLSAETLRALLEFQAMGAGGAAAEEAPAASCGGEDPAGGSAPAPAAPVCVAYTARDSLVIAQTLKRLRQKDEEQSKKLEGVALPDPSQIPALEEPRPSPPPSGSPASLRADEVVLADALERDGAVRIDGVLSGGACDDCLGLVNDALGRRGAASIAGEGGGGGDDRPYGFGNVFSRRHRCDLYLRPDDPPCARALAELLDAEGSRLGRVLRVLATRNRRAGPRRDGTDDGGGTDDDDDEEDWYFHEFSALVADPGCQNQPLHPDAPYSPVAPLYTAFVALQAVGPDMGPTVVVPGTHRIRSVQEAIRGQQDSNVNLRDPSSYRRALLGKGDCLLMDARTYHLGSANASATGRRRALLYLTLRNPRHGTEDSDFPPDGSLFDDLRGEMKLSDYSGDNRKQACAGESSQAEAAASSGGEPAC
jgi:hypothetical protein